MTTLHPTPPWDDRLYNAITTAENALTQLYHVRMLDIARILRGALPTTDTVIVDTAQRDVEPYRVGLHSILDTEGHTLWTVGTVPPSLTGYDCVWGELRADLEYSLTSALDTHATEWKPVGQHIDSTLLHAQLPNPGAVTAAVTDHPSHLSAHLHHHDSPGLVLSLARPATHPTVTVNGVDITAFRDADNGTLTLDISSHDADDAATTVAVRVDGVPLSPLHPHHIDTLPDRQG